MKYGYLDGNIPVNTISGRTDTAVEYDGSGPKTTLTLDPPATFIDKFGML